MSMTPTEREQAIEWIRDIFAMDITKVLLSVLIILSVLPFDWAHSYGIVFFGIFSIELALRGLVLLHDLRRRRISGIELVFLAFDLVATLSFLPAAIWSEVRFLRLFRLSRMLLLLDYWGPVVREVWLILAKRERRYQLSFFAAAVLILSFTSAILLSYFQGKGIDMNGDGVPETGHSFGALLWWSFRQIESADNLLRDPDASLAFAFSIFLTLAGLFLFSFLIGIGTSIVEELVAVSKERRIGMRKHSVICNVSPHSEVLLEQLVEYYAKSFRTPSIVTLGNAASRYDYMYHGALQKIRYRQGEALARHDLEKVDADRATRVILVGYGENIALSDSQIVSQILSVREVNPRCPIYAELFAAHNVRAALAAGRPPGEQIGPLVPIMASRLVGLYLANIVVFPGVEVIYDDLLSPRGDEIYTCIYDMGAMAGRKPPSGALLPFGDLLERGQQACGVTLLGYLVDDAREPTGFIHAFVPGGAASSATAAIADVARLRGFFGVAASFEELRGFVESLPDVVAHPAEHQAAGVVDFGTCPGASQLGRFLICGFHDGLVDFCEALVLFTDLPSLVILVADAATVEHAVAAFVDRPDDDIVAEGRIRFRRGERNVISYDLPRTPGRTGTVQVAVADWSEQLPVELPGGQHLCDMDGVLLTYAPGESDRDARSSLALLKLIHLKQSHPEALKASVRVYCEVQSGEKAALFARRFGQMSRAGGCPSVSVVAADGMRNSFLAQSVFVPGAVNIYRELLSEPGVCLCKLLPLRPPADPDQELSFGRLQSVLYQRDGVLLVAVELREAGGERRVVLNPRQRSYGSCFAAGDLTAVFAVGDFSKLPRSPLCPGCFDAARPSDL